jgi:hypothetical protein
MVRGIMLHLFVIVLVLSVCVHALPYVDPVLSDIPMTEYCGKLFCTLQPAEERNCVLFHGILDLTKASAIFEFCCLHVF